MKAEIQEDRPRRGPLNQDELQADHLYVDSDGDVVMAVMGEHRRVYVVYLKRGGGPRPQRVYDKVGSSITFTPFDGAITLSND